MNSEQQEITEKLIGHLERRQANKTFIQSKGIQILNKDFIMMSQIGEGDTSDSDISDIYNLMKNELYTFGYSEFRFLGTGAQGTVILAKNNQNVRYAIKGVKVRDQQGKISEKKKKECDNEIIMLQNCSGSPHTLNLIQVIEGKQMCFLVLNECKGTLEDLVIQVGGRLNEFSAIKYSKDIAEGLSHIHQKGFLVQDVKLDNILIDYNNNAVVADLGLGNKIQSNASYSYGVENFMGNQLYCAPEVQDYYQEKYLGLGIEVSQKPRKKSNAFSLGYIIYGLLFSTKEVAKNLSSKDKPLKFSNEFSQFVYQKGLKKIILGLTKFNPIERISVYDSFLMLKGLTSFVFQFEERFNEVLIGNPQSLKQIYKNQIEVIQQSQKSYLPIMANEKLFLLNVKQNQIDQSSMIQIEQLKKQLTLVQQENQALKRKEIPQLQNQLKDFQNIIENQKQQLQQQQQQALQKQNQVSLAQNQKQNIPLQNGYEGKGFWYCVTCNTKNTQWREQTQDTYGRTLQFLEYCDDEGTLELGFECENCNKLRNWTFKP